MKKNHDFGHCYGNAWRKTLRAMKLTAILFFLAVFTVAAEGYSQGTRISMKMEDASLKEVFRELKLLSDYTFVYSEGMVADVKIEDIDLQEVSVEDALKTFLEGTDLEYYIENNVVVIRKKAPVVEQPVQQEKKIIKGKVTDDQGFPLPGVSVIIKGTTVGVATNIDGEYTVEFLDAGYTLVFSFVGMITQEIDILNQTVVNVTLLPDTEQMDEVVVTGYQTISRERTTGSFGKVDSETLDQRPVMNLVDRLEGTVSGLNVVDGKIQIRGISTLTKEIAEVLYVVDGFPIEGDLSSINPEDIESVNVLKDASAASIWGVRASNGVIVVTTKKGKVGGKINVNFSTHIGITEKIDYSKMDYMSTSDQIDLNLEVLDKGWNINEMALGQKQALSLIDEAYFHLTGKSPDGDVWSQAQFDKYVNSLRTRDVERQWEKYLLRKAVTSNYNLSISGGSEKNTFYSSIVYNDERGASIGNSSGSVIFNIQDTYKFNEKLTFTAGITSSLRKEKNNGVDPSLMANQNAYEDLVDENGNTIQYYKKRDPWSSREREAMNGIGAYSFNQLDEQRNTDKENERISIRAKFGMEFKILDNLTFSSNYQYEKEKFNEDQYNSMSLPSHRIRVYEFFVDGKYQIPLGTEYKYGRSEIMAWDFRNTLTWDNQWGDHKLNMFAGTEIKKRQYSIIRNKEYGYDKQTTTSVPVNEVDFMSRKIMDWNGWPIGFEEFFKIASTDLREVSFFSNAGYELMEKYSLNASFRVDQKNLFGSDPKFRYKPLWSVGLGWNIHKEDFMNNLDFINRLKLRGTYGINGNASDKSSPFAQALSNVSILNGHQLNYLNYSQPANEALRWEETSVLNLGIDFAMFSNRLNGSLEYYHRNSKDLLGYVDIDSSVGFGSALMNYASMINEGVELGLNAVVVDGENFQWRSSINFSYNHNEVTKVDYERPAISVVTAGKLAVGEPLGNIYSFNYAGLDANGDMLLYNTDGSTKTVQDADIYGALKVEELKPEGKSVAPFYGGLSNTFSYKNLDLNINITYKFGHKFRHHPGLVWGAIGNSKIQKHWLNRWQKPGDELKTRVPGPHYNGLNPDTGKVGSFWDDYFVDQVYPYVSDHVYNAAFIRVRDITLGYNLPTNTLNLGFIKNLRLTAQVSNPFLWVANEEGLDPEAYRGMAYDNLKTFTFGVKANF